MKKYFNLQFKRMLRILLPVILIAAILFACVLVAYDFVGKLNEDSSSTIRYKIGIVGTAGDMYMQLGMAAMESIDSTRFALELIEMEESEAEEEMRNGTIAAFIVIPEGFLQAAFRGEFQPLKFVSSAGAVSIVSLVKEEFTEVIQLMLTESQKGTYGAGNAMADQGHSGSSLINEISISYAEYIFDRGNMYRTNSVESFDGLGMGGYFATALSIVFFMLICLTFAPLRIRKDHALTRMLCAQRRGILMQVVCDFAVYLLGLLSIALIALLFLWLWMGVVISAGVILQGLSVIFSLGAMSFVMYELSSDYVSGILLQFFVTLVMCFICGCMYPISFFPEAVQRISAFLPVGLARMQIANCMLGDFSGGVTFGLLGYGVLFLSGAFLVRKVKATLVRG